MAMAMTSRLKAWANYVTKCPICLEVCVDPRSPPCLHAFCFRCISAHCGPNAGPGDEVDCPVCRQRFEVPDGGVNGLQHNFLVADLISVKDADETVRCCDADDADDDDAEVAMRDGCGDGDGASGNVASGYCEVETCCATSRERKDGAHSNIRALGDEELKLELGQPADDVESESRVPAAVLSHVTPPGKPILAMTSLHNKVYVIRYGSSDIEVYDDAPERTFRLERRRLRVPGLGEIARGLAACGSNNCLYVSDYWNSSVHRVELRPGARNSAATTKWPVARRPAGLSVTTRRSVLVTCSIENKLQEFTTLGRLVREIRLRADLITCPFQAVETPNGELVVSQNTSTGNLVLVGADGHILRSLNRAAEAPPTAIEAEEQRQRSKTTLLDGQMAGRVSGCHRSPCSRIGTSAVHCASKKVGLKCPKSLTVSKDGFVVVADAGNSRIVCVDPSLTTARQLELPDEDDPAPRRGLREPWAVALDDSRQPPRLYVGTSEDGRLFVFDNVDVNRTHVDC